MADTDRYSDEDVARMTLIERAIIDAIQPLVEHVNPVLALWALIRCARVILRKGDGDAQRLLLPVIDAYMRGVPIPSRKVSAPGRPSMLWQSPGPSDK